MKTPLLLSALVLASVAACGASSETSDSGVTESCPAVSPSLLACQDKNNAPSFSSDVAPIINVRCSPCHFPGGIEDKTYDFSTRTGVVNAETAIINQLYSCLMPPIHGNAMYGIEAGTVPGLTEQQLSTIFEWIECGSNP